MLSPEMRPVLGQDRFQALKCEFWYFQDTDRRVIDGQVLAALEEFREQQLCQVCIVRYWPDLARHDKFPPGDVGEQVCGSSTA